MSLIWRSIKGLQYRISCHLPYWHCKKGRADIQNSALLQACADSIDSSFVATRLQRNSVNEDGCGFNLNDHAIYTDKMATSGDDNGRTVQSEARRFRPDKELPRLI